MEKTYSGLIIFAIFVTVVIAIVSMGIESYDKTPLLNQEEEEKSYVVEQDPYQQFESEQELFVIEKEQSESGLSRKADTPMTEEKITILKQSWGENDMRRLELSHARWQNDPKYQPMVIAEFETGKLSHVTSCSQLNGYYLLYYGQVYGNQWDYSNNKDITDYLKGRMLANNCEFNEQAELKEKIDAEKERVANATEKVMKELDEVYKEN